jgi:hypothetical protein
MDLALESALGVGLRAIDVPLCEEIAQALAIRHNTIRATYLNNLGMMTLQTYKPSDGFERQREK